MPDPFISEQDLEDYIGIDVSAQPGATIAVDAACDICRTVAEQTFTEELGDFITLDGTGTDALVLPERPVTNVGTVTVNGGTVTDYVVSDQGLLIRGTIDPDAGDWWNWPWNVSLPRPTWPEGRQNITVTYDHGYAGTVPSDVRMVALSIANRLITQGAALYETVGNVSVRYGVNSTDLTAGERMILRKYKPH